MNRCLKNLFYLAEQSGQTFSMDPMYAFLPSPFSLTYSFSLENNTQNVDEHHLDQVIHQLHIDEFTRLMPNGMNTYELSPSLRSTCTFHSHILIYSIIGERGDGISGGQKQVRFLYSSLTQFFIISELQLLVVFFVIQKLSSWMSPLGKTITLIIIPSALDGENESMVINTIYEDVNRDHGKTIIMITHRRESIIRCDRLYVLNQVCSLSNIIREIIISRESWSKKVLSRI